MISTTTLRRQRWLFGLSLLVILVAALFLRTYATVHERVHLPIRADAADYFAIAYNVKHYGVYSTTPTFRSVVQSSGSTRPPPPDPDAKRTPLFPLMLVPLLDELPGWDDLERIQGMQILFGMLTVFTAISLLVWAGSPRLALLLGALVAISPHQVMASVYVLTEGSYSFFVLVSVAVTAVGMARREWPLLLLAGLLFGLAALLRPTLLYFPLVLLPFLLLVNTWTGRVAGHGGTPQRRAASRPLLLTLVFGLAFALSMSPWFARNWVSLGSTSGGSVTAPMSVLHGAYPNYRFQERDETYAMPYRFDPRADAILAEPGGVMKELRRRFSEEPWRHIEWYLIGKPLGLWQWNIVAGAPSRSGVQIYAVPDSIYDRVPVYQSSLFVSRTLHPLLVLVAAIFSVLVWLPAVARWLRSCHAADSACERMLLLARLIALVLAFHLLVHVVAGAFSRYSIPFHPLAYMQTFLLIGLVLRRARADVKPESDTTESDTISRAVAESGVK